MAFLMLCKRQDTPMSGLATIGLHHVCSYPSARAIRDTAVSILPRVVLRFAKVMRLSGSCRRHACRRDRGTALMTWRASVWHCLAGSLYSPTTWSPELYQSKRASPEGMGPPLSSVIVSTADFTSSSDDCSVARVSSAFCSLSYHALVGSQSSSLDAGTGGASSFAKATGSKGRSSSSPCLA